MKKELLFAFIFVFSTANFAFSQYVPDTLKAIKTSTAPVIDGTIDPVWDNAQFVEISNWGDNDPDPDPDDFTATFKLLWDDEFVYFLGVAVDDIVTDMSGISSSGAPDWETDCFELYWAPSNTQLNDMTEMTQVRLAYANATNEDASSNVKNGWSEDGFSIANFVTGARELSDNGWVAEGSFDLAALAEAVGSDVEFTDGSVLGLNIMAGDNDNSAERENVGSWIADMNYNEADTSGILVLMPSGYNSTEAIKGTNISIYPNPVARVLHISADANIDLIEIVNLLGAKVLTIQNTSNRINVSQLDAGVYILNFYLSGELLTTHKMLKN